jgi:hypothetical protein
MNLLKFILVFAFSLLMYHSVVAQTAPPCLYDRFASQYRTNQQWNNLLDKACAEMNSNKYREALKTLDKAMYIDSIANIGDYTKDAYISMIQTKIRRYLEIVDEVETEKNALSGDKTKKQGKNTDVNSEKEEPKGDSTTDTSKKKTKSKKEKYYHEDDQYSDTFVNTKQESTDFHISKKLRKEKKKSQKKIEQEKTSSTEEETKKAEDNPEKSKKKLDKKAALIAVPVVVETIIIGKDVDASEKKETIKEDKKGLLKKFTK